MSDSIEQLIRKLRDFRDEREWSQFHDVPRLIRAIVVECGELVETIQWLTDEEANKQVCDLPLKERLMEESADVFLYLLLLADKVGFDLLAASAEKIEKNAQKYPVAKAKGNSRKYDQL